MTPDQAVTVAIDVLLGSDHPQAIEARGVLRELRSASRRLLQVAAHVRRCRMCPRWLDGRPLYTKYCSPACRQKAYLHRLRAGASG